MIINIRQAKQQQNHHHHITHSMPYRETIFMFNIELKSDFHFTLRDIILNLLTTTMMMPYTQVKHVYL